MLRIKQAGKKEAQKESWIGPAPWIETPPPGLAARAAMERDERVASPSYTRNYPLVIRRAVGSVVEDVDGNRYLDFAAGLAVCATGHCHPRVVAAIQDQAAKLIHASGTDFYYEPMIALAEKLAAIAPGRSDKRVLLLTSGAETAEAAFKLVRHHTGRKWVIAFHGASHGRTMGALSLTSSTAREKAGFEPLVPMVGHVPYGDIDVFEEHMFRQQAPPEDVAAIFVEPILGGGGYVVPPKNFLPRLRALCDRHGMLLVCDEIHSGMGRTGKMFACQHFGVVPDVLLCAGGLASGMPLGAVIAPKEVMNWPAGAHGSTFGGNPVSCAAALATIDLLESGLLANAAKLGVCLQERLREISDRRKCVDNPRGLGLMAAVDVVSRKSGKNDPRLRDRIMQEAFRRGLILLGCGTAGIRFSPPLGINDTQLDVGLTVFDEVVASVGS
ncbi:MAG TPA: aminotransferase class III-fold pyridoxal phosphate-dependent enzyme [Phycisphaerae bacterium]|nr:aminotransferase class III-fold pyridoxal phosphate-dependent enzyme [Phycisphaerae bacterium]